MVASVVPGREGIRGNIKKSRGLNLLCRGDRHVHQVGVSKGQENGMWRKQGRRRTEAYSRSAMLETEIAGPREE